MLLWKTKTLKTIKTKMKTRTTRIRTKTRIKAKTKIKKNIKKYGADAPYFFIVILLAKSYLKFRLNGREEHRNL